MRENKNPDATRGGEGGSTSDVEREARRPAKLRALAVHKLRAHPLQPPERHSDANVADLVASIRELGLLEPPTVWQRGNGTYVILFGHRRVRACQLLAMQGLGNDRVRVFVRDDLTTGEAALLIAAECGHHRQFSPVHTASVIGAAYRTLSSEAKKKISARRMAAVLPWKKTSVNDYLRIDQALQDPRTSAFVRSMDKEDKSLLLKVLELKTFSARLRAFKAYQEGGAAAVRKALAAPKGGRPQKPVSRSKRGQGYDMTLRFRPTMSAEAIAKVRSAVATLEADLGRLQTSPEDAEN